MGNSYCFDKSKIHLILYSTGLSPISNFGEDVNRFGEMIHSAVKSALYSGPTAASSESWAGRGLESPGKDADCEQAVRRLDVKRGGS